MKIALIVFCAFLSQFSFAQNTFTLQFTPPLPPDLNYIRQLKDSIQVAQELQKVMLNLKKNGYFFASFDQIVWNNKKIEVDLEIGLKLKNISVEIPSEKKSQITNFTGFFSTQENLLKKHTNNGFPFTKVQTDSIYLDSLSILHLKLKVEQGQKFVFDSLSIESKDRLPIKVIRQLIGIKYESIFKSDLIDAIESKIGEIPFLRLSKPKSIEWLSNKAHVRLIFEKRAANRFDAYLGLLPPQNKQGFQVVGELNLKLLDLFHQAETVDLLWKHPSVSSQKLTTQVRIPYFVGTNLAINTQFGLDKRDSSFLNLTTRLEIARHKTWNQTIGLFLEYRKSIVLLAKPVSKQSNTNSLVYGVNSVWNWDRKYTRIHWTYSIAAGQRSGIESDKEYTMRTQLELKLEQHLFGSFFLKNTLKAEKMFAKQGFLENEMMRSGGLHSLRGFAEESIPCSQLIIPSLELKYNLVSNSSFYVFYDWAFFETIQVNETSQSQMNSFGLGLELTTKTGVFSLIYAIPKTDGNTYKLMEGLIHIGYTSRF